MNNLEKEIKNMSGNVLAIGSFDEKIIKQFIKNKKITDCNIIGDSKVTDDYTCGKTKKIRLSRLRKLKHKRINYLICNYDIEKYIKTFIKDSIYITKDYIYFIVKKTPKLKELYNRYDVTIEEIKLDKEILLKIDVTKAKNNVFKEAFYSVVDFIKEVIELITNLLLG